MKNKTCWRFLKIMLISGSIFISTSVLALILLGWKHQNSIKNLVLENLQNKLNAELHVGSIKLDLVKSFPLGSIAFADVAIHSFDNEPNNDIQIHAKKIKLQFNVIDILKKKYVIKQLTINEGNLSIAAGNNIDFNNFFNTTGSNNTQANVLFNINNILVNDVDLLFADHTSGNQIQLKIINSRISTPLTKNNQAFKARGKLDAYKIHYADVLIPETRNIDFDLDLVISDDGSLTANNCRLRWDDQQMAVNGSFGTQNNSLWTDVNIQAQNLCVAQWLDFLPTHIIKQLHDFQPEGKINIDAAIKQHPNISANPYIQATFTLHKASLLLKKSDTRLENLFAQGYYTNGSTRSASASIININSFNARIARTKDLISGSFRIEDLLQPRLSLSLNTKLMASELLNLTGIENIPEANGRVAIDMAFNGTLNNDFKISTEGILAATLECRLSLENVSFRLNSDQSLFYHSFNGNLRFHNNRLVIDELWGKAGDSDFRFSGFADDLIPYLLLPNRAIYVETHMHSNKILLDELLQQNAAPGDTIYQLRIPKRLKLKINASINELGFRRFVAGNISGSAQLNEQVINADALRFDAMDGHVKMTGIIDGSTNNEIWVHTDASLDGLDINKLFYQTGNFGQTGITHENIHGLVDASLFFSASWDKRLSIKWQSMETKANIRIVDGQMLNYHPLIALGRYIKTDNLDSVNFSALENKIHIKNRMINIPMMEVSSNVLDLNLSGKHSFDNDIDYRLRLLLSDLMARNHRERRNPQEQYGEIIDDGLERILFLRINGTAQNPVFRYDRESHADQFRNNLIEERQNLREILRDEFSFITRQNNDSINYQTNKRRLKREQIKQQEEQGFIIEWD